VNMSNREYSLFEIIRDPGLRMYESSDLTTGGRHYFYRYDAGEGVFYRATVPAGATPPHFCPLRSTEKVPIGGWYTVGKKARAPFALRLIVDRKTTRIGSI
jgi:hypothetical protein